MFLTPRVGERSTATAWRASRRRLRASLCRFRIWWDSQNIRPAHPTTSAAAGDGSRLSCGVKSSGFALLLFQFGKAVDEPPAQFLHFELVRASFPDRVEVVEGVEQDLPEGWDCAVQLHN